MPTAPEDDLRFIAFVADMALNQYALKGNMPAFGVVNAGTEVFVIPSSEMKTTDDKQKFVNIMRFMSIDHEGERSAIAMETWTLFSEDPEDHKLLEEIYARGGSMSEHPKAGEAIFVLLESDAGLTRQYHRIVRDGKTVTLEASEVEFEIPHGDLDHGIFSAFHISSVVRKDPAVKMFARGMRQIYGVAYEKPMPGPSRTTN